MPHILIIDDDTLLRDMMIEMVECEGFTVTGAEDGLKAQTLLASKNFDLVITDIVMPEKEGLETIMYLKKNKPHIPVIAISGGAKVQPDSYLNIAKQLGACFTLSKPFTRNEFVAAVHKCLTPE